MCELRMQHLQRHQSVVVNVVGEVDRGYAPTAELAFDAVAVGQGGLEAGSAVGQREVLREVLHGSTALWSRLEIVGAFGCWRQELQKLVGGNITSAGSRPGHSGRPIRRMISRIWGRFRKAG
jgi:hypothetical protein